MKTLLFVVSSCLLTKSSSASSQDGVKFKNYVKNYVIDAKGFLTPRFQQLLKPVQLKLRNPIADSVLAGKERLVDTSTGKLTPAIIEEFNKHKIPVSGTSPEDLVADALSCGITLPQAPDGFTGVWRPVLETCPAVLMKCKEPKVSDLSFPHNWRGHQPHEIPELRAWMDKYVDRATGRLTLNATAVLSMGLPIEAEAESIVPQPLLPILIGKAPLIDTETGKLLPVAQEIMATRRITGEFPEDILFVLLKCGVDIPNAPDGFPLGQKRPISVDCPIIKAFCKGDQTATTMMSDLIAPIVKEPAGVYGKRTPEDAARDALEAVAEATGVIDVSTGYLTDTGRALALSLLQLVNLTAEMSGPGGEMAQEIVDGKAPLFEPNSGRLAAPLLASLRASGITDIETTLDLAREAAACGVVVPQGMLAEEDQSQSRACRLETCERGREILQYVPVINSFVTSLIPSFMGGGAGDAIARQLPAVEAMPPLQDLFNFSSGFMTQAGSAWLQAHLTEVLGEIEAFLNGVATGQLAVSDTETGKLVPRVQALLAFFHDDLKGAEVTLESSQPLTLTAANNAVAGESDEAQSPPAQKGLDVPSVDDETPLNARPMVKKGSQEGQEELEERVSKNRQKGYVSWVRRGPFRRADVSETFGQRHSARNVEDDSDDSDDDDDDISDDDSDTDDEDNSVEAFNEVPQEARKVASSSKGGPLKRFMVR